MSYLSGVDVSKWNGIISWPQVRAAGYEFAIIKMSGGDDGLYLDTRANANYYGAQAAGLAIGMYHFAGGTDPLMEAEYFVNACSPLAEHDVMVLDWEVSHPDPVAWCFTFVSRVYALTGVWPLLYANGSTMNAHDWTPVTTNCGRWVAWYDRSPEDDLPVPSPYVMHQFTSSGSVPGIAGRVDLNAWFGSLDQFKAYGYHAAGPAPVLPAPIPGPIPAPAPEPIPEIPAPAPTPDPILADPPATDPDTPEAPQQPQPQPTQPEVPAPAQTSPRNEPWWLRLIKWLLSIK
jgi:lysozyme